MIIETSDNRFYAVREHDLACMAHCYLGKEVKRDKHGWKLKKIHANEVLIRKAATHIVEK